MPAISNVPADPTPTLCMPEFLLIVICVCGVLAHLWINKFSTFAVLHTAGEHQSRTLAILRQSLDSISFEEYTALFDRYTKLSDMRAGWKVNKYLAMLPAGREKRRWFTATRSLRNDAEAVFEMSTRDAIGIPLAERRKAWAGTQQV
ncbi:uncharacterized protein TRAVEDRAFT_17294 [Trametes versicolor FP-101664 SS1]|uniref:uncharacterized protein n=1 Tax=Trametes versicolor (strain FP-101664) TaxID=717944 RepID=UPI0004623E0E|nr:uncharacterized protein TRAVEDRAFT_17294 [Trametes versicolor FP-101664 SS1]EIW62690.1 hypothetical protein TRAVEDRAFT_17294 [Trametes versicolor FP-101664 SS1]